MSRPGIEPVTYRSPERTLYQLSYRGRSHEEALGPWLPIQRTAKTARVWRLIWVFAGSTCFVGFVMLPLICKVQLIGHVAGINFNIHIWSCFGYFIVTKTRADDFVIMKRAQWRCVFVGGRGIQNIDSYVPCFPKMSQLMRFWFLSHGRPSNAQAILRIRAVSAEPSLVANLKYGRKWRVRPAIRHLAI